MDYKIKIPIEYEGEEKFAAIISALNRTAKEVEINEIQIKKWIRAMDRATEVGFTFDTALNKVKASLEADDKAVVRFTDRLKYNIKEVTAYINERLEGERKAAEEQRKIDAKSESEQNKFFANQAERRRKHNTTIDSENRRQWAKEAKEQADALHKEQEDRDKAWAKDLDSQRKAHAAQQAEDDRYHRDRLNREHREEQKRLTLIHNENTKKQRLLEQRGNRVADAFGGIGGYAMGVMSGVPGGGFVSATMLRSFGLASGAMITAGAVGLGALGAYGMLSNANTVGKEAQDYRNKAAGYGVSTDFMQRVGRVSDVSGIDVQSTIHDLAQFNKELSVSGEVSQKVQLALRDLGLSVGVAFQKPEVQLKEVMSALRKVGDETERERLAVNLLGDAGRRLIPLVDTFDSISDSITRSGVIMDKEAIAKADEYRRSIAMLGMEWDVVTHKLAGYTTSFVNFLTNYGSDKKGKFESTPMNPLYPMIGNWVDERINPEGTDNWKGSTDTSDTDDWTYDREKGTRKRKVITNTGRYRWEEERIPEVPMRVGSMRNIPIGVDEEAKREGELQQSRARATRRMTMRPEQLIDDNIVYLQQDLDHQMAEDFRLKSTDTEKAGKIAKEIEQNREQRRIIAETRMQQERLKRMVVGEYTVAGLDAMIRGMPREFSFLTGTPMYNDFRDKKLPNGLSRTEMSDKYQFASRNDDDPFHKQYSSFLEYSSGRGINDYTSTVNGRRPNWGSKSTDSINDRQMLLDRTSEQSIAQIQNQVTNPLKLVQSTDSVIEAKERAKLSRFRPVMTSGQYRLDEYSTQLGSMRRDYGSRIEAAGAEAQRYGDEAARNPLGEKTRDYIIQAEQKNLEQRVMLNELQAKEIDLVTRFNESVESAAEGIRNTVASGITGVITGSINGGGRGASRAVRSFVEGQGTTIVHNFVGEWMKSKFGDHNPVGVEGKHAKLFEGTIFASTGDKQKVAVDNNTSASIQLNNSIVSLDNTIKSVGTGVGGGYGTGSVDAAGISPLSIGKTGDSVVDALVSGAYGVADVARAGSPSAALGKVTGLVGGFAGSIGSLMKVPGGLGGALVGSIDGSVGLSTGQKVGLGAAAAGAGLGVYQGISTASKGGARNIAGGIAESLGSIAAFTGPAAPFVAAAAATAALIASFLPDPKQRRGEIMADTAFKNQYLAPESQNLSVGRNGGFSDVDMMGNVRDSFFSPYPRVSGSYLDFPRRTVVPGRTNSPFGGFSNDPGQQTPNNAPRVIIIQAMDGQDVQRVLSANSTAVLNAFHQGISDNYHPVVNELARQTGAR